MSNYSKAIVAVLIAALTSIQTAMSEGPMTTQKWVTVGLAVVGAIGVYLVPNRPS